MINETYKNSSLYYFMMDDFLQEKISPDEFQTKYLNQRDKDFDQDEKNGYTYEKYKEKLKNLPQNEKEFKDKYCDVLYEKGMSTLDQYEKGAKSLNVKGEIFFMGIWNYLDCHIIQFYPSNEEGFDPRFDTDEQTLIKIVQAAFGVLERNKDRWEYGEDQSVKI